MPGFWPKMWHYKAVAPCAWGANLLGKFPAFRLQSWPAAHLLLVLGPCSLTSISSFSAKPCLACPVWCPGEPHKMPTAPCHPIILCMLSIPQSHMFPSEELLGGSGRALGHWGHSLMGDLGPWPLIFLLSPCCEVCCSFQHALP